MNQDTKDSIKVGAIVVGLVVMLANTVFVTYQFIRAYLSESRTFTMYIDFYHEATIETVIVIIYLPLALYAGVQAIKKVVSR